MMHGEATMGDGAGEKGHGGVFMGESKGSGSVVAPVYALDSWGQRACGCCVTEQKDRYVERKDKGRKRYWQLNTTQTRERMQDIMTPIVILYSTSGCCFSSNCCGMVNSTFQRRNIRRTEECITTHLMSSIQLSAILAKGRDDLHSRESSCNAEKKNFVKLVKIEAAINTNIQVRPSQSINPQSPCHSPLLAPPATSSPLPPTSP